MLNAAAVQAPYLARTLSLPVQPCPSCSGTEFTPFESKGLKPGGFQALRVNWIQQLYNTTPPSCSSCVAWSDPSRRAVQVYPFESSKL
jgi:hypothetical protein